MRQNETLDFDDELHLFRQASRMGWWRWRAECKRMRRRGEDTPFAVHLGQLQMLHTVWRELRHETGHGPDDLPHAVKRVARRHAEKVCLAYLRDHPDPD